MPAATVADLIETLTRLGLLEREQIAALPDLQTQFREPRALAKELVRRGWLTAYQMNQIAQGQGQKLLLGPYVLLERLGEGGMGQVFKARHRLGRVHAVKVIRKERLEKPDAIKRFQREIRAAAQLDHPHIVRAYDADEIDGTHFFSMEYVEGKDLAAESEPRTLRSGVSGFEAAYSARRLAACAARTRTTLSIDPRRVSPGESLLEQG